MIDKKAFLETPMGKAVNELGEALRERGMPPVTLNVIGGFAMMMRELRDPSSHTDIDYVGTDLGEDFDRLSDRIGAKHGMGKGWINNDGMLTGYTMEDFELSTGKLTFDPCLSVGNVSINVLRPEDLLRLKAISLDTSLMAVQESSAEFTRSKDLPDLQVLMEDQGVAPDDLPGMFPGLITSDRTVGVIKAYLGGGLDAALDKVDEQAREAERRMGADPADGMPGIDGKAESQTELGKSLLSGGFSIGSILSMAEKRASRPLPRRPSRTGPDGPDDQYD